MSYPFETADAIVVAAESSGEADKILWILSAEHGLLVAKAQGLRHLKSKLRYVLQEHSRATISLLRGKNEWRVATAVGQHSYFERASQEARKSLLRFSRLLRRMLGEAADEELFALAAESFERIVQAASFEEAFASEQIASFRLLHHLGYVHAEGALEHFLSDWPLSLEAGESREMMLLIEQGVRESQL